MIYYYDILFSFQVKVDNVVSDAFTLVPTHECTKKLQKSGLIFKKLKDETAVIVERVGEEKSTAEPIRKIKSTTVFSFILFLNDSDLLGKIIPYKRLPNATDNPFPPYSGRSRKLYFNNLNATFSIEDTRNKLSHTDKVSDDDLGSVTLNKFGYTERDPGVNLQQITFTEISPVGGIIMPYGPGVTNRTAQLELNKAAYHLKRGPHLETLYAESSLIGSNALGIIEIFKDETIQYDQEIKYEIPFSTS